MRDTSRFVDLRNDSRPIDFSQGEQYFIFNLDSRSIVENFKIYQHVETFLSISYFSFL